MNWAVLIAALIQVESGGDCRAVGDRGNAYGSLQIWPCVVQDVNRIKGCSFTHEDMFDPAAARFVCFVYLNHYGKAYTRKTGRRPTAETYARIWNGGPNGWKKTATDRYWGKVEHQFAIREQRMDFNLRPASSFAKAPAGSAAGLSNLRPASVFSGVFSAPLHWPVRASSFSTAETTKGAMAWNR